MPLQFLKSERLILRRWQGDDLEAFFKLSTNSEVMAHSIVPRDREASDAVVQRIEKHFAERDFGFWAVEVLGVSSFIGFVGLITVNYKAHFTPAVTVGWRLDNTQWGRGYATEAAELAISDGFTRLRLEEIVGPVSPGNRRSKQLVERLGMTRDERDDFVIPNLPDGHPLKQQMLYRLSRKTWEERAGFSRLKP